MSEEAKVYTCSVCGKPTPNYHEWSPSVAAILGEQGSSTCDECFRKAQISYKCMRGEGSLREDSTLCLLWAMLMDSYTRWRTTGGVFVEASD